MKRIVSLVLALSMVLSMFSFSFAASKLTDVAGTKYESAVEALIELGVVDGYPDGTFLPSKVVTRAELAKLLVTAYGLSQAAEVASGTTPFADVEGNWAAGYINVSADYKFVNGYPDGNFQPNETVTIAEALTMCLRVLGYSKEIDAKGTWPTNYIAKAQDLKLIKDLDFKSYNDGATRGNIALLVWNMLRTNMWTVVGESEGDGLESRANTEMINVKFPDFAYVDDATFNGYVVDKDSKNNEPKVLMKLDTTGRTDWEYKKNDFYQYVPGTKVEVLVNEEDGVLLSIVPNGDDTLVNGAKKTIDEDYEKLRETEYDYVYATVSGKEIDKYTMLTSDSVYVAEITVKESAKSIKINDGERDLASMPDSTWDYNLILRDGERIKLSEVKKGEVLTTVHVLYDGVEKEAATFYVVGAKEEKGEITRLLWDEYEDSTLTYPSITIAKTEYKLDPKAKYTENPEKSDSARSFPTGGAKFDSKMKNEDVKAILDPIFGNVVRVEFDGKIDGGSDGSDVHFYGFASEVYLDGKDYKVTLIAEDGTEKDYVFANDKEGQKLYDPDVTVKGYLAAVEIDDDGEIDSVTLIAKADPKGGSSNSEATTSEKQVSYGTGAKEYYAYKLVKTATYEEDDAAIVADGSSVIDVNSSVTVVTLSCDDKGNDKEKDDEYTVKFAKGLDGIKKLRKEDAIVIWDADTSDDVTAKYVVIFEDSSDRSDEKVAFVSKYLAEKDNNEVSLKTDADDKKDDIVTAIDKKNLNLKENETVLVYTTKVDSKDNNVLTVVSSMIIADATEGTGIAEDGGYKATIGGKNINFTSANGKKDYEKYKFVYVDVETNDNGDFVEISYVKAINIDDVSFKRGDRFYIDTDEEVFYIVRGFEETKAPATVTYSVSTWTRNTSEDAYTQSGDAVSQTGTEGATATYTSTLTGYTFDKVEPTDLTIKEGLEVKVYFTSGDVA